MTTNDKVNYILENKETIEVKIAYPFRNRNLLIQAFTRKSFASEHDGFEDNEILEYYGDQLVNTVMTKRLFDSYSTVPQSYSNDFFHSQKRESELTKIRANYVNKSSLAHCIEILGLDKYLLLGKSDEKNEVRQNEKVRCDLFESIIGAIAVDSAKQIYSNKIEWNFEQIEKSCNKMWEMLDFNENYIEMLYEDCEGLNIAEPQFRVSQSYYSANPFNCRITLYIQNSYSPETIESDGTSEIYAKMNAAKKALDYLYQHKINQILEKATPDTAVQTLNTLYLKKFISKPELNCSVSPDEDGNQIWRCECFIKEYENCENYNNWGIGEKYTKSEAKQAAAYDMICFMLGKDNDAKDTTWTCPYCGAENSSKYSICQRCFDDDD